MTVYLHATWQGSRSTYSRTDQDLSRSESCSITLTTPEGRTFAIKPLHQKIDRQPHNLRFVETLSHHRQSCPHSFIAVPAQDVHSLQLSLTVSRIIDSPRAGRSSRIAPIKREAITIALSSLPTALEDGDHYKMTFSMSRANDSGKTSPQVAVSKIEKLTRSIDSETLKDTEIC